MATLAGSAARCERQTGLRVTRGMVAGAAGCLHRAAPRSRTCGGRSSDCAVRLSTRNCPTDPSCSPPTAALSSSTAGAAPLAGGAFRPPPRSVCLALPGPRRWSAAFAGDRCLPAGPEKKAAAVVGVLREALQSERRAHVHALASNSRSAACSHDPTCDRLLNMCGLAGKAPHVQQSGMQHGCSLLLLGSSRDHRQHSLWQRIHTAR